MCTVLLPPGVNQIAVKYIISYQMFIRAQLAAVYTIREPTGSNNDIVYINAPVCCPSWSCHGYWSVQEISFFNWTSWFIAMTIKFGKHNVVCDGCLHSAMHRVTFTARNFVVVCFWRDNPQWAMASSFLRFLDHTQLRTTVGRTPPDEWSACRRDLYLTTHNTHNRQTSMPPVGFEPTISAGEIRSVTVNCHISRTPSPFPVTHSSHISCSKDDIDREVCP
jgi:hypothetical protein